MNTVRPMIERYAGSSMSRWKFSVFHTWTICVVKGSIAQKAATSSVASDAR